jgi:formate/nitrite transporter FocA (FNT family)
LPYGVVRLLGGLVFSLGLILVIVGGAVLFTGNNLIVMAWASGKVRTRDLLENWVVAFAGNFVGAFMTAILAFYSTQYSFGGGAVGLTALTTAHAKTSLAFIPAVALGILCNALDVSRRLDVLRRAHQRRSNPDYNSAGRRFCRCRF